MMTTPPSLRTVSRLPLLVAVLLAGQVTPAAAARIRVPSDAPTIAAGLAAAIAGDTVLVAPGTYTEFDLVLPTGVVVLGATGDPADVIVDAAGAGRCFYGKNLAAPSRLEGLTLRNAIAGYSALPNPSWGGGLYMDGGVVTVAACVFEACDAAIGGGAFVDADGDAEIRDCLFTANGATESAGLRLTGFGSPLVENCTFRGGDRTVYGGGLTFTGVGTLTMESCVIEDNTVIESGGGLEVYGSSALAVLTSCRIAGNSAGLFAGGIDLGNGGRLEAHDTTVTGNMAPSGPDGVVGSDSSALLHCCEFDPANWAVTGELIVDDSGCGVGVEPMSWGSLKSAYR